MLWSAWRIGGNVGGLRYWVHGIVPFTLSPATGCTIKNAASAWAAGPLTSIGAWLAGALAVSLLLKRVVREGRSSASMLSGFSGRCGFC
jgi:hypothetical protein